MAFESVKGCARHLVGGYRDRLALEAADEGHDNFKE
jgi:hypothetical protein